jgi:repressor LexA
MGKELPERQQKVLECITDYLDTHGFPPTVREIGEYIDVSSTSLVSYYLKRLEERGLITREPGMSRAIQLNLPEDEEEPPALSDEIHVEISDDDVLTVPMMGYIAAGAPINVETFSSTETIEINRALFGRDVRDLFALKVQGDSMIDALINDGDTIILKPAERVENGQMAAVWLKSAEETTLKKVYYEGKRVRLQPANPTMEPIYVPVNDVQIQGKVVLVIRKLE